jgi:ACS family glucarate transporter-like MFS transporter
MPVARLRLWVLAATAFVAFNMYLDRACLSQVSSGVKQDLHLTDGEWNWALSAFFWSYALAQVPAAALGKRYGYRLMLTAYLLGWSWYTGVTGLAWSLAGLGFARLMVGLAEAGAYPTAAALVRGWFPLTLRGRASSTVAIGGRVGLLLSMLLTPLAAEAVGWRVTLVGFGVLGIFTAGVFWYVVRDTPAQHPWTDNNSEPVGEPPTPAENDTLPFRAMADSRNLWLASLNQFAINVGWAFLITKMPEYFESHHGVSPTQRGLVSALPVVFGMVGMIFGGWVTDALSRRFGVRWGRRLPMGSMPAVAGVAYLVCADADNPWVAAALIGVMALATDLANPAYWAFAQDVGRRHAATALGWGNTFGQIGAGLSPVLLGAVKELYGWPYVFVTGSIAFAVGSVAGFLVDAAQPIAAGNRGTTEE